MKHEEGDQNRNGEKCVVVEYDTPKSKGEDGDTN